ncbi:hypothetical protein JZ751_029957 [Albula glossodonta]|uniref:Uncharacterized protein n=1 Tax=Albula glossodonta TaxID=121402 RepID=A0A8T2NGY1_9TELE|nr:hypothetical protein JZ751_029957 [Albula glossodonta]
MSGSAAYTYRNAEENISHRFLPERFCHAVRLPWKPAQCLSVRRHRRVQTAMLLQDALCLSPLLSVSLCHSFTRHPLRAKTPPLPPTPNLTLTFHLSGFPQTPPPQL